MKFLFRVWLSINSTFWLITIFGIANKWNFIFDCRFLTDIVLVVAPIVSTFIASFLFKCFAEKENTNIKAAEIQLADNEFLPVYLGYFFVALGLNDIYVFWWVYGMILFFVLLSQYQYFNPILILEGYHFYHITTEKQTKIFVIVKGRIIRNADDIDLDRLQRLNDSTFIGRREK